MMAITTIDHQITVQYKISSAIHCLWFFYKYISPFWIIYHITNTVLRRVLFFIMKISPNTVHLVTASEYVVRIASLPWVTQFKSSVFSRTITNKYILTSASDGMRLSSQNITRKYIYISDLHIPVVQTTIIVYQDHPYHVIPYSWASQYLGTPKIQYHSDVFLTIRLE